MRDPVFREGSVRRKMLAVSALLVLLCGVFYYLWFRSVGAVASDPSFGTFPSLVHMLGLSWLAMAIAGTARGFKIATALLLISLLAEWRINIFDPLDAVMLVVGYVSGCISAAYYLRKLPQKNFTQSVPLVTGGLMLTASFLIVGSGCYPLGCSDTYTSTSPRYSSTPVYMDYQTLRSSVRVTDPRPVNNIGRVYVYQSAVFLNQKNQGIHVLDNTNPANPVNAAFIEIPGNTELSIRDGYLYVDSYVDLVTLDINDPLSVQEVDRKIDIFPYDEYQNIPEDDVYLGYVDQTRGVVIGYED